MATNVDVPALGESVREAVLIKWHKQDGEAVAAAEPIAELETDKANVDVPAPTAGVLQRVKKEGDTVAIGETIARIDEKATATAKKNTPVAPAQSVAPSRIPPANERSKPEDLRPSVRRIVDEKQLDPAKIEGTGPGGKITKEDATRAAERSSSAPAPTPQSSVKPQAAPAVAPSLSRALEEIGDFDADGTKRVPMSKIRKKIAERLVQAQQTAAILTTFNEVDMSAIMDLRAKFKEKFEKTHGVGLGFMSFFARACVMALREFPRVNAEIDGERGGNDVIYHEHVNLGIAVSTDRGLAVPVLRHVEKMGFAKIESEIKRLAAATREGKLSLEELSGGTFTITNGGVFGSLLSTPIINPPQSGILGMHAIQKRPVAVGDEIKIRPMMYIALSYDHRLVDGRESVSFLVRLKEYLEDPTRLMLEV
jgi:2-oxoglutarate dehydrogenase E2 component (dihydrolipoamide succinyltransferase)